MNSVQTNFRRLALPAVMALGLSAPTRAQTFRIDVDLQSAQGSGLALAPDGGSAVVGNIGQGSIFGRLDAAGALVAVRELALVSADGLFTRCSAFMSDGTLVIGGVANGGPWLAGLHAITGNVEWQHSVGGSNGNLQTMAPTADGGIIAAGSSSGGAGGQVGLVVRTGAQGQILWKRDFGTALEVPYVTDVLGTSDGGALHVATADPGDSGFSEWGTVLTRLGTSGEILWQQFYGSPEPLRDGHAVETADGGFALVGVTEVGIDEEDFRFWSMRVDAVGNVLWSHRYETYPSNQAFGSFHRAIDVVTTPDGGFVALVAQPLPLWMGSANNTPGLMKLDGNGDVVWFRNLGIGTTTTNEIPLALHRVAGGFLFAARRALGVRVVRTNFQGSVGGDCAAEWDILYTQQPLVVTASDRVSPLTDNFGNPTQMYAAALFKTGDVDSVCGNDCYLGASGLGTGLAGAGGLVPQLTAQSGYCIGGDASLELTSAVGGTVGILGISTQTVAWPFLGGTNYLPPVGSFNLVIFTDGVPGAPGAGTASLPIQGDLSGLTGATIYSQAMLLDPAAPEGWSMTAAATLLVL